MERRLHGEEGLSLSCLFWQKQAILTTDSTPCSPTTQMSLPLPLPSPSSSNPCSPSTSLRCLFSKMPTHICAPLIHLSSFMRAAPVERSHKSHPGPRPWPQLAWGNTQQQQATTSHRSPAALAAAGATIEPCYTMFS